MEQRSFKVYGYRWVMLTVFMLIVAVNQLLWITFAPITSQAMEFYGVSDLEIGLLSLIFMAVYILVSIPASWVIDTYGIRPAVGIGAALTGIFGLLRGSMATDYTLVLVSQIGIAIGQPFILNAVTKIAARWFAFEDRATASGFGTLAMYLGIVVALMLTPRLSGQTGIDGMLMGYGIAAAAAAVAFLIFARERPPSPPGPPEQEERSLVFDGLKQTVRKRDFVLLMVVFFVGLGAFNAVTTWIEEIVKTRNFTPDQAGMTGGLMVLAGVVGAVVMPLLSDRFRQRVPFLVAALVGTIAGLVGLTFAASYPLLLASAFVLGFSLLSAGPIGFQYGAEVAYPAPEGTSNGLLLMMGQISGIVFILAMVMLQSPETGSMTSSLVGLVVLLFVCLILATQLKESPLITGEKGG